MKKLFPFYILPFAFSMASAFAIEDEPTALYQEVSADPWFVRHSIIISLLLLLLLVCLYFRWRHRRPVEIFSNATGRIQVTPGALADLVQSAALQYGAASRPRVQFYRRRGLLHLDVRLKLGPGQKLPQFSSGLQTQLSRALRDAFGIENLGGIHVIITGFKGHPLTDDLPPYHGAAAVKNKPAPPRDDNEFFGSQ